MQGIPSLPEGRAFGAKSGTNQHGARSLIRGFYSPEEQLPDRDLGQCLTQGRRNYTTQRPFGVPSIRTDRGAPIFDRRSVANSMDYGDEPNADRLIFPSKFHFQGVSD